MIAVKARLELMHVRATAFFPPSSLPRALPEAVAGGIKAVGEWAGEDSVCRQAGNSTWEWSGSLLWSNLSRQCSLAPMDSDRLVQNPLDMYLGRQYKSLSKSSCWILDWTLGRLFTGSASLYLHRKTLLLSEWLKWYCLVPGILCLSNKYGERRYRKRNLHAFLLDWQKRKVSFNKRFDRFL